MTAEAITFESTRVEAWVKVAPKKFSLAALRALKKATKSAHTDSSRIVAKDTGLKVGEVRKRLRRIDPNGRTLAGAVLGSFRRLSLILFKAKGPEPSRGRGRVTARSGGKRAAIPHAFIATMKSGRRGVFKRKGHSRLPVGELLGPSVGRVLDRNKAGIMLRGRKVFNSEFDRLLVRIIGKGR